MSLVKKLLLITLKLALTISLFVVLFKKIDTTLLSAYFSYSNLYYILLAALLTPVYIGLKIIKWYRIVEVWPMARLDAAASSYMAGLVGGILTPGRLGEFSRFFFIKGLNRSAGVVMVLYDKMLELYSVLLIALYGIYTLLGWRPVLMALGFVAFITLLFTNHRFLRFVLKENLADDFDVNSVNMAMQTYSGIKRKCSPGTLLVLTLLANLVPVIQVFILFKMHLGLGLLHILAVLPLMTLFSAIPITISGLGLREMAGVYLFGVFGVSGIVAVKISLLLFLINGVLPALVGFVFFWKGAK